MAKFLLFVLVLGIVFSWKNVEGGLLPARRLFAEVHFTYFYIKVVLLIAKWNYIFVGKTQILQNLIFAKTNKELSIQLLIARQYAQILRSFVTTKGREIVHYGLQVGEWLS